MNNGKLRQLVATLLSKHDQTDPITVFCILFCRLVTIRYLSNSAEHLQVTAGSNGSLLVRSRFVTRDFMKIHWNHGCLTLSAMYLALPLQPTVPNPSPLPMLVLRPQIFCPQVQVLGIRLYKLKMTKFIKFDVKNSYFANLCQLITNVEERTKKLCWK